MFTILAAFALLDATTSGTARVTGRTDANQRGRHAMDVMTRSLRSQVCVNGVPPILAADVNEVTFAADLSAAGESDQRRITFNPTARTVSLGVKAGSGNEPGRTFPGAFVTKELLADVVADGATPFFSYWADVPGTGGSQQQQLTTLPLPATDLRRVARVDITFVARPTRANTTQAWASAFEDSITVRAVDADNANPTVECP
jgi:hypothetical protein